MSARLVIGSLLVLSLVSGPHGIAQEVEQPLTPRSNLDALRVPTDAEDAALFHTVLGTLTHDLELPVAGVTLETLDVATFAQVLANARVRQDPSDLRGAAGVALGHRILVRSDMLSRMTIAQRARLYAHELAHAAQVRLGGNGEPSLTWIDEGHATWVAYRVGDRLGHRLYADSRDEVRRWVRASSPSERFPALSDLETSDRWILAANQVGWAATYGQAFLAVDRLVERYAARSSASSSAARATRTVAFGPPTRAAPSPACLLSVTGMPCFPSPTPTSWPSSVRIWRGCAEPRLTPRGPDGIALLIPARGGRHGAADNQVATGQAVRVLDLVRPRRREPVDPP